MKSIENLKDIGEIRVHTDSLSVNDSLKEGWILLDIYREKIRVPISKNSYLMMAYSDAKEVAYEDKIVTYYTLGLPRDAMKKEE